MYSVPSKDHIQTAPAERSLSNLHCGGWFVLTMMLALLSVFLSNGLHTALQPVPPMPHPLMDEQLPDPLPHQLIAPLIFDKHSSPLIAIIAWGLFPGLLIALLQALLLVAEGLMHTRVLGFIFCCALLWGAFIGIYLSIYPEPGLTAEPPHFGPITLIACLFISPIASIISAMQRWAMIAMPPTATQRWVICNTLGYAIGWSLGMYVLSRTYSVELFDCFLSHGSDCL